jgi:hypothetical protein
VTVIEFIQMIVGYILTGYVDRQEFYVMWGSNASNGKSFFWGEIVPGLLGEKYYARITSDAFADTGNPNNDQLYYLNGKRYAFMSEPRKGQKSGIDNELLKTITGDKDFTCQAKYKNKLTFKLLCKIVTACNDLPDFNFDDAGTYRRVVTAEQNVTFLEEEDYNTAPQEMKDKMLIGKKDNEFASALLADKEGTMRWALEGAKAYMANPRMPVPDVMKATKQKAKDSIDVMTQWLRGNLEKGPRSLSFKAIKDEWRNKGLNFEQTKKGFSIRLASKVKLLGFLVDEGRAGKSEEKIINCRLIPDAIDGLIED